MDINKHIISEETIVESHVNESLKLKWTDANFSKVFGLRNIAAHIFTIPSGYRSSEPHAEKCEEEFVFVLEGEIDLWLNGRIKTMKAGDCIGFPAGTGVGHCFINNSPNDVKIFVSGDRTKNENQCFFHLDPSLKEECGDFWWDNCPSQDLGEHKGWPGEVSKSEQESFAKFYEGTSLMPINSFDRLVPASFSYPGDTETFGDGLCLSRLFKMESVAIWLEKLAPGKRSSWPHAHSKEEEFAYILKGKPHVWLDGSEYEVMEGDCIDFKAGSRVAHTLINNSDHDIYYLCVGECDPDGDQIFYPLHPLRNKEMKEKGLLWE
jgi:uncharacterized cupin superfamily protein